VKVAWGGASSSLRAEARANAAHRHPSMVTVHAIGNHSGIPFIVMERIYGVSLEAHLEQRRTSGQPYALDEALDLLRALVDGLTAVHRAGISHRDVKPANVMLTPGNRLVIMDLGLFRPEFDAAGAGLIEGSPDYMAPEVIRRQLKPGTGHLVDVYAVGVMAFEILTGERPFRGATIAEILDGHLTREAPDVRSKRGDVPPRVASLIRSLLSKDPEDRPQSAEIVAHQLERVSRRDTARPFSVLIVDDDEFAADLVTHIIRECAPDVHVESVSSAELALERMRKRAPDLMLLDLELPGMNGIELCMYLRGTRFADATAIVSISAETKDSDQTLLRQLGVTRFVSKTATMSKQVKDILDELKR
jgi:eukaryotic-like serine/threonine-protein kinase